MSICFHMGQRRHTTSQVPTNWHKCLLNFTLENHCINCWRRQNKLPKQFVSFKYVTTYLNPIGSLRFAPLTMCNLNSWRLQEEGGHFQAHATHLGQPGTYEEETDVFTNFFNSHWKTCWVLQEWDVEYPVWLQWGQPSPITWVDESMLSDRCPSRSQWRCAESRPLSSHFLAWVS